MANELAFHEQEVVYNTAVSEAIMQHLDRTFWLGGDVLDRMALLREHLTAAVRAVDAYVAVKQAQAAAQPGGVDGDG